MIAPTPFGPMETQAPVSSTSLPSSPRVLALLAAELALPSPELRRLDLLLRTDPALTWSLLVAANEPARGLAGQIHSVAEALAVVALDQVRALVDAAVARASLKAVPGVDLPQFWRYSLEVARFARALARAVRQNQGAAYTCGLLHGVGEWLLHLEQPQEAAVLDAQVPVLDLRRARAELRHFGYSHADLGADRARSLSLPAVLVDTLRHQTAPFDNDAYEPLAGVLHLAVWRARCALAGLNARAQAATFPASVGEVLGLDMDRVLQQDPFDWFAHT